MPDLTDESVQALCGARTARKNSGRTDRELANLQRRTFDESESVRITSHPSVPKSHAPDHAPCPWCHSTTCQHARCT